jgi:hypothetical protein
MSKKPKHPETILIAAMVVCVLYGLYLIGFSLRLHSSGELEPPSEVNWNDLDSVRSWIQNQHLHTLIYQLIPISGGVLLCIAFLIWNYCRKWIPLIDSRESGADVIKNHWHYRPLAALAVAFMCFLIGWLSDRQGYLTFRLFGLDFGFAHLKSLFFLVWFGGLHRFPLDLILYYTVYAATGVAMFFVFRHFILRRSDASY